VWLWLLIVIMRVLLVVVWLWLLIVIMRVLLFLWWREASHGDGFPLCQFHLRERPHAVNRTREWA
jgi:hypothetical protein